LDSVTTAAAVDIMADIAAMKGEVTEIAAADPGDRSLTLGPLVSLH
jgi:hypothetical protein